MMFKSVGSLAVYVTDLERAKKFYTEILGFEVRVALGPDLCFLVSDSGEIDVYLEGGYKPTQADCQTARLGFFLETRGSVLQAYQRLRAKGAKLIQDAPEQVDKDIYTFQVEDPDGNIIDVSGRG